MRVTQPKPPRVTSLILCDRVERDEASRKFTIVGTVSVLTAADLSVPLPCLSCFASVERGDEDERDFGFLLVGPDGRGIAAGAWHVRRWNDLGEYQSSGMWTDVQFRVPGVHVLRVMCGDRVLAERKLLVRVEAAVDRRLELQPG